MNNKYADHIMQTLREIKGLDEMDCSLDQKIENMKPAEVFDLLMAELFNDEKGMIKSIILDVYSLDIDYPGNEYKDDVSRTFAHCSFTEQWLEKRKQFGYENLDILQISDIPKYADMAFSTFVVGDVWSEHVERRLQELCSELQSLVESIDRKERERRQRLLGGSVDAKGGSNAKI